MLAHKLYAHVRRLTGTLIFMFAALALISMAAEARGQSNPAATATVTSTLNDQKEMAVTVYNQNRALVRDVRRIDLPAGELDLRFMDIAAKINPATVHIVSQTAPTELVVLEQNYEYDLLNPDKLLDKYVGREVTLVRFQLDNNTSREVEIKATLLADNENKPVWKVGDQIVTGIGHDRIIFPDLPANLYSKPTLIWLLSNRHAGPQTLEASYLTDDMNWNADYVLTLASTEKSADLNGWVTVVNNSGTDFRNAQLQLVAGALNVVRGVAGGVPGAVMMKAMPPPPAPQFAQENISEYHLYTLDRRTTLQNNESKQISLLEAANFPIEKHYQVSGQSYYYQNAMAPGEPAKDAVEVHLKFKNSQSNSLGMPLPAGTVRVYQSDSRGQMQFVGEDHIDHTPIDERLDLHIGNAFDIVEERKQTDYQRIDRHTTEAAFEIKLRNHKSTPVTVEVNEPIGGDWTMLESSFKYEKTSATSARFMVPVPANGEAVLTYRVRVRW
ncbi:MAG TPA: DUF4139 domain-containing protein [Terriglobia bacterium]